MRRRACFYCTEKTEPSYKEVTLLKKFITDRGKILPRIKTGICAAHQRELSTAIKRARQLAMIQFAPAV